MSTYYNQYKKYDFSKCDHDDLKKDCDRCGPYVKNHDKCKPDCKEDCCPKLIDFECKSISGSANIPVVTIGLTPPVQRTLGTITADLNCFCKPCVKLDFSAFLTVGVLIAVGSTITFRVFKRCDNQSQEIEVASFDIAEGIDIAVGTIRPINFSVCDCDGCPAKCCTYRVTAEATALVGVALGAFGIVNGTLSIIAADQC